MADAYLDAAPRPDADVVDVGAFTLFVSRTPWDYYARPTRRYGQLIGASDLKNLGTACRRHGVDLAIEWICEVRPELAELCAASGLSIRTRVLMVAAPDTVTSAEAEGATLRIVDADDPALAASRAVAEVSFGFGGTQVGPPGPRERDAAITQLAPGLIEHLRHRARSGLTVTAVAEIDGDGVVAGGSYQPMSLTAEVLAVATLPSARRRGLATALTGLLTRHALTHGVMTVLLSAEDDDVARIYEQAGFIRVATAGAAH